LPVMIGKVEMFMGPRETDGPDDLKEAIAELFLAGQQAQR
jgi:hypothetical protein